MGNMFRGVIAATAVAAATNVFAGATTYYVDVNAGKDSYDGLAAAWDGTHGPKRIIQDAVDAAAAGDTIRVAAGLYGEEQGVQTELVRSRVYVGKNLTIAGAGRDTTFILGALGDCDTKQDATSVRGIDISSAAPKTVITGFTFTNCANTAGTTSGAAVYFGGGYKGFDGMPWVADCAARNCYSYLGAFSCVNVARTMIADCHTRGSCSAGYKANFVHSIITRCSGGPNNSAPLKDNPLLYFGGYVVNCTMARNGSATALSEVNSPTNVYNCVVQETAVNGSFRGQNIHNCVTFGASSTIEAHTSKGNNEWGVNYQLAAPALDDFRPVDSLSQLGLVTTAKALTAGASSWLADIPEAYRYKDYNGTSFSAGEGGVIAAGAIQTSMHPFFGFESSNVEVDGVLATKPLTTTAETMHCMFEESEWPKIHKLRHYQHRNDVICYSLTDGSELYRHADTNGVAFVAIKPGKCPAINAVVANQKLYVAKTGSDTTGDGTEAKPYLTIQKAVDQIVDNSNTNAIVYVGAGEYSDGGKVGTLKPSQDTITNRVCVNQTSAAISIRATEGPAKTAIVGAPDPDAQGAGPAAVRCVRMSAQRQNLIGFTLRDGYAAVYNQNSWNASGGAFCGVNSNTAIMDSVITNCAGYSSVYSAKICRCRVVGNVPKACVLDNGDAISSVFVGNRPTTKNPSLSTTARAIHCTFREGGSYMGFPSLHGYIVNTIVDSNGGTSANASRKLLAGCIFNSFTYSATAADNVVNRDFVYSVPQFVDAANGDLRLKSNSPAFGLSIAAWDSEFNNQWTDAIKYENFYQFVTSDIEGNEPRFIKGKLVPGAHYRPARQLVAFAATPKNVEVSTSIAAGETDFGSPITYTITSTKRPIAGITVNGELHEGVSTVTVTPTVDDFAATCTIGATVQSPVTWYANPYGSDDNDGWTEATAVKSLKAAMRYVESGDIVIALPGAYDDQTMLQAAYPKEAAPTLPARVVVPNGVTLKSRDGADTTFIEGVPGPDSNGLGDGAVRCVYLGTNSCLNGFTVRYGGTLTSGATADVSGGGILSAVRSQQSYTGNPSACDNKMPRVEDCVICNCSATVGGGAFGCSFYRTKFFYNTATSRGPASADPWYLIDSVVDSNYGSAAVSEAYYVIGSTIGANNKLLDKNTGAVGLVSDPGVAVWWVKNTLFLGGAACKVRWAYNCAMPEGWSLGTAQTDASNFCRENCKNGLVAVDANYRPVVGANCGIDQANAEYRPSGLPDLDGSGAFQRTMNAAMDIGAMEADWRPTYANAIGRHLSVASADGSVYLDGTSKKVTVPDGSALTLALALTSGRETRTVTLYFTAESAVTVTPAGQEAQSFEAGSHELKVQCSADGYEVAFVSQGGATTIDRCAGNEGLMLIVR